MINKIFTLLIRRNNKTKIKHRSYKKHIFVYIENTFYEKIDRRKTCRLLIHLVKCVLKCVALQG